MATVLRAPLGTRIWAKDPAGVAIRAQDGVTASRLLTILFGQDKIYGAPGMAPDYDWPNPRRPVEIRANRTHAAPGAQLLLTGQDQFFGAPGQPVSNYDWPVPRGYRSIGNLSWSQNLGVTSLAPASSAPFAQYDWPNPLPPRHSYPNKGFLQAGAQLVLTGQDKFFRAPGVAPVYDYPNPLIKPPVITQKTHSHAGGQRLLLGQDKLPFRQLDWPLPIPKRGGIILRSWVSYSTPLRAPVSNSFHEDISETMTMGFSFSFTSTWTAVPGQGGIWSAQSGEGGIWTPVSPSGGPWTKH